MASVRHDTAIGNWTRSDVLGAADGAIFGSAVGRVVDGGRLGAVEVTLGVVATGADGAVAAETTTGFAVIAVGGCRTGAAAGGDDGACAADGDGDCGCGRVGDGTAAFGDTGVDGTATGDDGTVVVRGDGGGASTALPVDGASPTNAGSTGASTTGSSFARAAEVAEGRAGTATDGDGFCVGRPGSVAARSRKRCTFAVETVIAASRPARSRRMEAIPAATPLSSASVMPIV